MSIKRLIFSVLVIFIGAVLGCKGTMEEKDNQVLAASSSGTGSQLPTDAQQSADMPEHMAALRWTETGQTAKQAAANAIADEDYRLLVTAGRGTAAPGVPVDVVAAMKERCGTKYIEGSTDVIRGDEHRAMLMKAYEYAADYNKVIIKHCQ
jgi:hypothetical protein